LKKLNDLHRENADSPGLPIRAFPALGELALRVSDDPDIVGP
jgi:hypothetical protein